MAEDVTDQLDGLERLSRLNTELGNERTVLAWIRTSLAAMRTAYRRPSGDGVYWLWLYYVLQADGMSIPTPQK